MTAKLRCAAKRQFWPQENALRHTAWGRKLGPIIRTGTPARPSFDDLAICTVQLTCRGSTPPNAVTPLTASTPDLHQCGLRQEAKTKTHFHGHRAACLLGRPGDCQSSATASPGKRKLLEGRHTHPHVGERLPQVRVERQAGENAADKSRGLRRIEIAVKDAAPQVVRNGNLPRGVRTARN